MLSVHNGQQALRHLGTDQRQTDPVPFGTVWREIKVCRRFSRKIFMSHSDFLSKDSSIPLPINIASPKLKKR